MNKEGQEYVADLLLLIEELEQKIKKLTEENEELKKPNGLELAMQEEWTLYENVLREN